MIVVGTLAGVAITFAGVNPIDALVWSSVFDGIAAPPLIALVLLAARTRAIMGEQRVGPLLTVLGWITFAVVTLSVLLFAWASA